VTGDTQPPLPIPTPPSTGEFCAYCGTRFKEGTVFCEMCGGVRPSMRTTPPTSHMDWRTWALRRQDYAATYKHTPWRAILKAFFAVCILSIVFSLIAGLVALIYGVGLVTPYILDTGYSYPLFIVLPIFVTLLTISGYPLLSYYLFLVAVIVASCTWVFLSSYKGFFKELTMKAKSREHSPIFDIGGLVTVNAFVTVVIVFIAILLGSSDTGSIDTGTLEDTLFKLANASVWEEIIVRVLMIGLPLLVIDLVRQKSNRHWHSYILGGKFEFGIPEVVLVIVSATIFGFAHFVGGWPFWKVPAASIGGIAFGYLFLRYGLASAIVMHFAVDYSGMPSQVFGYSNMIEQILIVFWLGLGFVFTIYYMTRIGEFLTGVKFLETRPEPAGAPWPQPMGFQPTYAQQQAYAPAQYGQQPQMQPGPAVVPQGAFYGGYICPNCGNREARWVNGQFQCLRCGKLT
jgi:membrane protease YdiL (CAAX protease family)